MAIMLYCKIHLKTFILLSYVKYTDNDWNDYIEVNEIYFNEIKKIILPGDIVFIQDYQLMLLPELLKKHFPEMLIGYFLHIPFPAHDTLDHLSIEVRKKLLKGIMGA